MKYPIEQRIQGGRLQSAVVLSPLCSVTTFNVAINKPTFQQYPVLDDDRFDSSNAVDGRKSDLGEDGGQCAVSAQEQTATLWVNLTSIHSIHHITVYFMTDNDQWGSSHFYTKYYLGFTVYVSNTSDMLQGTLCFKDDNFTTDTIPAVFTTTCPVHGQYVIYYNERLPGVIYPGSYSTKVFSDLCEVEVVIQDLLVPNAVKHVDTVVT
uniref:Uncharacterized protein n=1 Tax=Magallana gigas TaxID=29159 RepID=K1P9E1_MAGGI